MIVTSVEMGVNVGELLAIVIGVIVALITAALATWLLIKVWRGRGGQ